MSRGAIINWAIRLALAGVFVVAGVLKTLNPAGFAVSIKDYHLVPWRLAATGGLFLPYLEILCGIGLLLRPVERGANALLLVMVVAFSAAIGSAWARGLNVECGCFGSGANPGQYTLWLARNLCILAGLVLVSFYPLPRRVQRAGGDRV